MHFHLHLGVPVFVGAPVRYRLDTDVTIATPLASRGSLLLAWEMMVLMGRVTVHGQGRVGRLTAGGLMSRGKRRGCMVVSWYAVLNPRVVLSPLGEVLGVAGGQMGRLRCAAEGVIRVVQSAASRGAIIASDAQWRRAVLHRAGRAVTGYTGVGQRSRTTHLPHRLTVDVGEAFGESSAVVGQEPNASGSRARRPKF